MRVYQVSYDCQQGWLVHVVPMAHQNDEASIGGGVVCQPMWRNNCHLVYEFSTGDLLGNNNIEYNPVYVGLTYAKSLFYVQDSTNVTLSSLSSLWCTQTIFLFHIIQLLPFLFCIHLLKCLIRLIVKNHKISITYIETR